MHAKKIKKRCHAVPVMEHFSREMPVEELNSISDGFGQCWLRKGGGEGGEIQLKNKVTISTAAASQK